MLVIDCTATGVLPPIVTPPNFTSWVSSRSNFNIDAMLDIDIYGCATPLIHLVFLGVDLVVVSIYFHHRIEWR